MSSATLASRVARVQAVFTMAALCLVGVGTSLAVDALLRSKADEHLALVTARVAAYLEGRALEKLDWTWFEQEVAEVRPPDVRVELLASSGGLLFAAGPGLAVPALEGGCASRAAIRACALRVGELSLLAARDRSDDIASRNQFDLALFAACALAGLAAALGSRSITRRAVRPLSELAARVYALEPGTGRRLGHETGLSELDGLAACFDALVERFEQALSREKRFAAQASHELRTPLTIARAEIESLARGEQDAGGLARSLAAIDRLAGLVQALLWFARAQERLNDEQLEVVNLADLVRAEVESLRVAHSASHFRCELPDEALVRADEDLVGRAVANLLENAIKHGDGSPIEIEMTRTEESLTVSVRNAGPIIPIALREQIFLPFFRARPAPSAAGFGLGLPLARAVARAHGGEVEVGSASVPGTEMVLRLPLVVWHQAEAPLS